MQLNVDLANLFFGTLLTAISVLLGIVWANLRQEIARIEAESRSRAVELRADAKAAIETLRGDVAGRLEKGERRFSDIERDHSDLAASISELKIFMKDALAQFRLDMIKDHPTKEDYAKLATANDSRFHDLRELMTSVVEGRPQRRTKERAS